MDNVSYKRFKKLKTAELYTYLFIAIMIFEFLFCNSSFFISVLKNNIVWNSFVFSFARIVMYITFIIIVYLFKNIIIESRYELEINNKGKANKIIFLMLIFILVIMSIYVYFIYHITVISISIILLVLLFLIIIFRFFGNNSIINIMLLCSVTFIYAITVDLYHPVDEQIHFVSSYNISQGNLNFDKPVYDSNYNNIPVWNNFNTSYKYNIHYTQDKYELVEQTEVWPSYGSKFLYFPSATGIKLAQLFNGTIIDVFYYGRFFNSFLTLIGIYFIMKFLPYKKQSFYVLMTLPFFLLLSGTYSVDGLGCTAILLFISYILHLYNSKKDINIKNIFILMLLFIPIILFKSAAYFFVIGLVMILPIKRSYKNNKNIKLLIRTMFLLIMLFCIYKVFPRDLGAGDYRGGNTGMLAQLHFLISNPLHTIKVYLLHFLNTFQNIEFYTNLNDVYFYTTYSRYFTISYMLMVIYLGLTDDDKIFDKKIKLLLVFISLLIFLFTSTALLLSFTEIGNQIIKGYQPRYIWPLIPIMIMCFATPKIKIKKSNNFSLNIYTLLVGINFVYLCLNVFSRIVIFVK